MLLEAEKKERNFFAIPGLLLVRLSASNCDSTTDEVNGTWKDATDTMSAKRIWHGFGPNHDDHSKMEGTTILGTLDPTGSLEPTCPFHLVIVPFLAYRRNGDSGCLLSLSFHLPVEHRNHNVRTGLLLNQLAFLSSGILLYCAKRKTEKNSPHTAVLL